MKYFALILIISSYVDLYSCKKIRMDGQDGSKTKGVENLTGEKIYGSNIPPYCGNKIASTGNDRWVTSANEWIATLTLNKTGNQKENLRKATKESVANLPASVLELIADFKLDVIVHDEAPGECKPTTKTLDESKKKILEEKLAGTKFSEENHYACFVSLGGNSRPAIHIGGSPKLVDPKEGMTNQESIFRRLLVRNIGLAYARFFPRFIDEKFVKARTNYVEIAQQSSAKLPPEKANEVMNAARMVEDSKAKLAEFSKVFSSYKAGLKTELLKKDGLDKSAPIQKMQQLIDAGVVDPGEFDDIVFAEVFDSYFCNAGTRLYFERTFKAAAEDFAKNARVMIELVTPKPPLPAGNVGLRR